MSRRSELNDVSANGGPSPSGGAYAFAVLALVSLGLVSGLLLGRASPPKVLSTAATTQSIEVSQEQWSDEQPAVLNLKVGPNLKVVSPRSGTITASRCSAGVTLKSGAATFSVDGKRIVNLYLAAPPWRDFRVGVTGDDAAALNDALRSLGKDVRGSTVTAATVAAFNAVAKQAGAVSVTNGTIARSDFAWLPTRVATPVSCEAEPGASVQAGEDLATLNPRIKGATIEMADGEPVTEDRVFLVRNEELPLDKGAVDSKGLAWIAANPDVIRESDGKQTVNGQLRLRKPLDVVPVPAAALGPVDDRGTSCVSTPGGLVPVIVRGSQLGMTYVRPEGNATLSTVTLGPKSPASCG